VARRLKKGSGRKLVETKKDYGDKRVRARELSARRLVVVESDHQIWKTQPRGKPDAEDRGWSGAIVWVRAPHDAAEGDEQRLKEELLAAGAAQVRALPRAASPKVVTSDEPVELPADPKAGEQTMREVVFEMAREAAKGEELEMLEEALEEALTEAGL
jgi:hypothetical protein